MLAASVGNDAKKPLAEEDGPEEAASITAGVPLRGMLLWKGRSLPPEWRCAVCKAVNSTKWPKHAVCCECKRERVADWMRLRYADGNSWAVLQPGTLVQVRPRGAADEAEKATLGGVPAEAVLVAHPSPQQQQRSEQEQERTAVADVKQEPSVMEAELLDIMDAGSPGKAAQQGPLAGRPFARAGESPNTGPAPAPAPLSVPAPVPAGAMATSAPTPMARAGAPATPLPQRPNFAIGVVTDVQRVPRQLVHLSVFPEEVKKVSSLPPAPPVPLTIRASETRFLEAIDAGDRRGRAFQHFGLCDDCEAIYRIVDGDLTTMIEDERVSLEDDLKVAQDELAALKTRRFYAKQEHDHTKVLELTNLVRQAAKDVAQHKKDLTPKILYCPFCAWSPQC
mmetsp:Transcript_26686/g.71681  ORF Transcript_26686/g.71681 Transcript_26686/m.71681 type:complete len:394 (+) Transcript_26686:96-1277(+)